MNSYPYSCRFQYLVKKSIDVLPILLMNLVKGRRVISCRLALPILNIQFWSSRLASILSTSLTMPSKEDEAQVVYYYILSYQGWWQAQERCSNRESSPDRHLVSWQLSVLIQFKCSSSFSERALLKHWLSNLKSFLSIDRKEGVNVLNSYYRQIRMGLSIYLSLSSLLTRSLGLFSSLMRCLRQLLTDLRILLSTLLSRSNSLNSISYLRAMNQSLGSVQGNSYYYSLILLSLCLTNSNTTGLVQMTLIIRIPAEMADDQFLTQQSISSILRLYSSSSIQIQLLRQNYCYWGGGGLDDQEATDGYDYRAGFLGSSIIEGLFYHYYQGQHPFSQGALHGATLLLGYYQSKITLVSYLNIMSFYLHRLRNYYIMSQNSVSKPALLSLRPPGLTNIRNGFLSHLSMQSSDLKQLAINLRFYSEMPSFSFLFFSAGSSFSALIYYSMVLIIQSPIMILEHSYEIGRSWWRETR